MRFAPLALAFVLAGCVNTQVTHLSNGPSPERNAEVRAAIEAVNGELEAAIARGDGAAAGALYTDDALYMPPNRPALSGPAAIGADWQAGIDGGITRAELITDEVEAYGAMAYETGRYRVYSGDTLLQTGKFIVHWRYEDGRWKLHRDIFNADS